MPSAIEVHGLSKQFGPVRAVDRAHLRGGRRAGSPASSAPTARARPPPCGCCWAWSPSPRARPPSAGVATWTSTSPSDHVGAVLEATSFHPSRRAEDHLKIGGRRGRDPAVPGGRDPGAGRSVRRGPPSGGQVLAGHAPAPAAGHRPARRPGDPDPGRAVQRARPPGHPVAAHLHPAPGLPRARRAGLLPPALRDGGDRRRRGHRVPRAAGPPDHPGRARRPGRHQHRPAGPHPRDGPAPGRPRRRPGGLPPDGRTTS